MNVIFSKIDALHSAASNLDKNPLPNLLRAWKGLFASTDKALPGITRSANRFDEISFLT
jgi:hypothetical protein